MSAGPHGEPRNIAGADRRGGARLSGGGTETHPVTPRRRELRQKLAPGLGALAAFAVFAGLALLYAAGSRSREQLVIVMLTSAVMVVGIQIYTGNTGTISFGHVSLAGIAAYISAILSTPAVLKSSIIPNAPFGAAGVEVTTWIAILLAVAGTTVVAALLGLAINRVAGLTASIVTLAMMFVVNGVLTNWKQLTGGAEAFYGIPLVTDVKWALLALFAALLAARYFHDSRAGLRARAGRDDALAAAAMGVRVVRVRYISWVVSVVFAALGGALLGHLLGAIQPGSFYLSLTFLTLTMLVLGGMNSVTGTLIGAAVVTVGAELARYFGDGPTVAGVELPSIPGLSLFFQGAVILIVMLWRPGGIMGDREIDLLWGDRLRRSRVTAVAEAVDGSSVVSSPYDPVRTPEGRPARSLSTPALLAVRAVSMDFAGLRAVDGASLEVRPGEIVGLIGPNGAGKTTVLNLISGVYQPTTGSIELRGETIVGFSPTRIAWLGVARTFQNIHLFSGLSVRENLEVGASTAASERPTVHRATDEILDQFDLVDVAERKAVELPYGRQRAVEMARAVALAPDILLLDEPAAGMNEAESEALIATVRAVRDRAGCAILLIDHDLHFVLNLCEWIYVLDAGAIIAEGTPESIQREACVIQAYLGTRAAGGPEACPAP